MNHYELLSKVHRNCEEKGDVFSHSLCAVVELHKPWDDNTCSACLNTAYREFDPYPCETIQAIEKELG